MKRRLAILIAAALVGCGSSKGGSTGNNSTASGATPATATATTPAQPSSSSTTTSAPKPAPQPAPPTGPSSNAHASVSDVGRPTGLETELLDLVNRARANPPAEGQLYGLDFSTIPARPPLAPNGLLAKAAYGHANDMVARKFFAHVNPDGLGPEDRIRATGYPAAQGGIAENIICNTGGTFDAAEAHKRWIIDQGINPPGHRYNILGYQVPVQMRELGIAFLKGQRANGGQFDDYSVEDFGVTTSKHPFVTGNVFDDKAGAGRYKAGEGLGNVTITLTAEVDGSQISLTTGAAGAYAFEINDAGNYIVQFQGGPFGAQYWWAKVKVAADNVKVDCTLKGGAIIR